MKKITVLMKINLIWVVIISAPVFMAALYLFRLSSKLQFQILVLASLVYLITALLHHYKDKTLTLEIIIEYVLIAALALLILQGLMI